jgi:hypothetical protein
MVEVAGFEDETPRRKEISTKKARSEASCVCSGCGGSEFRLVMKNHQILNSDRKEGVGAPIGEGEFDFDGISAGIVHDDCADLAATEEKGLAGFKVGSRFIVEERHKIVHLDFGIHD